MTDRTDATGLNELLAALPYFKALDPRMLARLGRGAVWREYAAGDAVFREGDLSPVCTFWRRAG